MTPFMYAGCECSLPSVILARIIELGLQRITGAFSPSDMSPPIQVWVDPSGHTPSQCFLLIDSGFAPGRSV